jgi:hypothetical protein
MGFEKTLLVLLLFIFSVFLFPSMVTAVEAVSVMEPLQPIVIRLPLIWLGSLLVIMGYSVIDAVK